MEKIYLLFAVKNALMTSFLKYLYNLGLYYNTKEYYDNNKIDALGMAIYKNRV